MRAASETAIQITRQHELTRCEIDVRILIGQLPEFLLRGRFGSLIYVYLPWTGGREIDLLKRNATPSIRSDGNGSVPVAEVSWEPNQSK
jgi:hypothetical protein